MHACQLFVAALGASSLTYAEATFTQTLPDWIGSHTRAFSFYGGAPAMVVSDNLRSGITKACFYEPGVNRAYAEMAESTTTRPSCRHGRENRATRRVFHTAPCSGDCAAMEMSRAARASRPPQPLRMVCCAGSVHKPRFKWSLQHFVISP